MFSQEKKTNDTRKSNKILNIYKKKESFYQQKRKTATLVSNPEHDNSRKKDNPPRSLDQGEASDK